MTFKSNIKDVRFFLDAVTELHRLYGSRDFADLDQAFRDSVLEAASDLAEEVLAPLNGVGDRHGVVLKDGKVVLAPGFDAAIALFAQGGWNGLSADPELGGLGMPKTLEYACFVMFMAANLGFMLLPTLSVGAIDAIQTHGNARQKTEYVPRLASGEWSSTMNLTESQAGTDLAAIGMRAITDEAGGYRLTGGKIFISWGDHDASRNILHLVLARLPDAPEGTKGISLFLCPKFLPSGERNSATVAGIEHKLGVHASPTCVMSFDGAQAELLGAPNAGMAAMFTMMNSARLAVGFQGAGLAHASYQMALDYALQRRQGKPLFERTDGGTIYDHPDVRRMLAIMKAKGDAALAICLLTASCADLARHGPEDERARQKRREDFLTPIAKAWSTDVGAEVASLGIQVHGGMGYIEETGAAQYYRDARIPPIYEGTNGIQAADLVGRKLGRDGLAAFELVADIRSFAEDVDVRQAFPDEAPVLANAAGVLAAATDKVLASKAAGALGDVAAGATTYLKLCGDVIGGWLLLKSAMAVRRLLDQGHPDTAWLESKISTAKIYSAQVLVYASGHRAALDMGAPLLASFDVSDAS